MRFKALIRKGLCRATTKNAQEKQEDAGLYYGRTRTDTDEMDVMNVMDTSGRGAEVTAYSGAGCLRCAALRSA